MSQPGQTIDPDSLWRMLGQATADLENGAPGLVTRVVPGAWAVLCDVDIWEANWVACHAVEPGTLDALRPLLDEVEATGRDDLIRRPHVRARPGGSAVRRSSIQVPRAIPPLMWRGNQPFARNPRPYPGVIRRIPRGEDLRSVTDIIARAFEADPPYIWDTLHGMLDSPAMRCHVAESDGLDSICLTWRSADVVYISMLATDPDRQRRGAGREVLVRAMTDHAREGAIGFYLLASDDGQPLYNALGFETFERPEFWTINPEPD